MSLLNTATSSVSGVLIARFIATVTPELRGVLTTRTSGQCSESHESESSVEQSSTTIVANPSSDCAASVGIIASSRARPL
jgi:hypothetical protein